MSLDADDSAEILNCLDQMIGKAYTALGLDENKLHQMCKIRFTCRVCKNELFIESRYGVHGWASRLLSAILDRARKHSKLHQNLLALPKSFTLH